MNRTLWETICRYGSNYDVSLWGSDLIGETHCNKIWLFYIWLQKIGYFHPNLIVKHKENDSSWNLGVCGRYIFSLSSRVVFLVVDALFLQQSSDKNWQKKNSRECLRTQLNPVACRSAQIVPESFRPRTFHRIGLGRNSWTHWKGGGIGYVSDMVNWWGSSCMAGQRKQERCAGYCPPKNIL